MAVKTITIDMDAYDALARHKKPGQSFSQVIKEHFGTIRTARDLRTVAQKVSFSKETLDALDRVVESRADHPAPPVDL